MLRLLIAKNNNSVSQIGHVYPVVFLMDSISISISEFFGRAGIRKF